MTDMSRHKLDPIDRRIVDILSHDARVSNRSIAKELGVTEGTIRQRIKRLQKIGLIQFTVVTDFRMAGSPNLCMMGIDADPSRVSAIAEQLKGMPEINCVVLLLGRFNLLAMGLFTNIEQLDHLVKARSGHWLGCSGWRRPFPSITSNMRQASPESRKEQRRPKTLLRKLRQMVRQSDRAKSIECLSRRQGHASLRRKAGLSGANDCS